MANEIISTSFLSNPDLASDVYYVFSNPAKIESVEIIKVNSIVNRVINHKEYKLNKHRIIVKQNQNSNLVISDEMSGKSIERNTNISQKLSENLDACLIKVIDRPDSHKIKYFQKPLWKIFSKPNPKSLLENFSDYRWIITTKVVADELSKLAEFNKIDDSKNINHFGQIGNLSVFTTNLEEGVVYAGKSDSIMSIVNKDIKIQEFDAGNFYEKGFKIVVEYLIVNRGVDKFLIK